MSSPHDPRPVRVRDLSFGDLFKVSFAVGGAFWLIMGLIVILTALGGGSGDMTVDGEPVQGVRQALTQAPILILVGALMAVIVSAIGALVVRLVVWWMWLRNGEEV